MGGKILVTGATGNVGIEVIAELRRRGLADATVAATHNVAHARTALGDDIGYVHFDFAEPASYAAAFAGVEKLFLLRPPQISDVARLIAPAIRAAKQAGVQQVVFLSLQGVERIAVVPHAKIEAALREVNIPWTMLRPSFFMENLSTTHRDEIRDGDELFVPAGQGRTSFIAVRDIGAVAGLTLAEPGHSYQAYELTGADPLTYGEVATLLSEELGRPIRYRNPSLPAFVARWHGRGKDAGFILVMAAIYTTARLGLAAHVSDTVQRLLGRPPTTMRQFIVANRAVWQPAGYDPYDALDEGYFPASDPPPFTSDPSC